MRKLKLTIFFFVVSVISSYYTDNLFSGFIVNVAPGAKNAGTPITVIHVL